MVLRTSDRSHRVRFLTKTTDRLSFSFLILGAIYFLVWTDRKITKEHYPSGELKAEAEGSDETGRKLTLYWKTGKPHYVFERAEVAEGDGRRRFRFTFRSWDRDGKMLGESNTTQ